MIYNTIGWNYVLESLAEKETGIKAFFIRVQTL